MKNQNFPKNLIIGFALGVIVTATLGAALKQTHEVGRYQIEAGPNRSYVVDTVTGQVWITTDNYNTFRDPKTPKNQKVE